MSSETPGHVITFYSYKGGTGRTMALANVAVLLARAEAQANGKGVLMVDWDLEAPGLHKFFRSNFKVLFADQTDHDRALDERPGLIDLFSELADSISSLDIPNAGQSEETARGLLDRIKPERFILKTDIDRLDLLKAGRDDDGYSSRVNTFGWEALFDQCPFLIRSLAERFSERYRYILVDSRTGLTDISGISTMLMPEKLIVVFTPNRQSILGGMNLVRRATNYRKQSDDLRPLIVFPLASRVESTKPKLIEDWRFGNVAQEIPGYQTQFERLFEEVYKLPNCDLDEYFNEVQIQHVADYAFGEVIPVLLERPGDRLSLTRSYETLVEWLAKPGPWDAISPAELNTDTEEQNRAAENAFARLSQDEQELAQRVITRLVRLARREELGEHTRLRVKASDYGESEKSIIDKLTHLGFLVKTIDNATNEETIELADDSLVLSWERMKAWLNRDRDFLLWRQQLQASIAEWETNRGDTGALLRGAPLKIAVTRRTQRSEDLNESEKSYIKESASLARRRRKRWSAAVSAALVVIASLMLVFARSQLGRSEKQPEPKELQIIIADGYEKKGLFDLAIENYTAALKSDPALAEAYFSRGNVYEKKKNFKLAIADYDQAIELHYEEAESHYNRGIAYFQMCNYDQAIADYDEAVKLRPDFAEAFLNRAIAYITKEDQLAPQAIEDFKKVIGLKPGSADAYYAQGELDERRDKRKDRAIESFGKAIRIEPKYAAAYGSRGRNEFLFGFNNRVRNEKVLQHYDSAITNYNEAIRLATAPSYDGAQLILEDAYLNRGKAYQRMSDEKSAKDDFEAARLSCNPGVSGAAVEKIEKIKHPTASSAASAKRPTGHRR